jgi:hypothetical protein
VTRYNLPATNMSLDTGESIAMIAAAVGAITGIIGAITGVIGAVLGLRGYRHAKAIKSLDLRIELKKYANDARLELSDLSKFIDKVHGSHVNVSAVIGTLNSGGMEAWKEQRARDAKEVRALGDDLPPADRDYAQLPDADLEAQLVAVHKTLSRARQLRQHYQRRLELDDKERERIAQRYERPPG